MPVTSFKSSLVKKEQEAIDAWKFYFRKPSSFKYEAGQYVKMKLPLKNPDNRGSSRYFTISSSPTEEFLMITTRILKSTFKKELGNLEMGTKVDFRGPWGDFVLDEKNTRARVFLAGGIGITPYHSIIKYVADCKFTFPIILFVSYKEMSQILFKNEFEKITKDNRNIRVITTITEPKNSEWSGETGRITIELLQKKLDNLSDNVYYIAGPDPMVDGLSKMLKDFGIPQGDILEDGFPGY